MAHRLLLADDSITIQKVVELVLAEEDFEIRSVSNGEDAFSLLGTFRPEIVLADIEMPKINGYQLCEKIKQNPQTAGLPVILLAGAFEPIDEELASKVGADDSVIKPFESQELISKINAALTMASAIGAEVFAEPVEEAIEIVEDESAMKPETAGVAAVEEDLWSMEEITGLEGGRAAAAVSEEAAETLSGFAEEVGPATQEVKVSAQAEPQVKREVVFQEIAVPSREELLRTFERAVDEKVSALVANLEIKDALLASLMPSMKDSIEKILWEITPELVEKMLKDILKGSVSTIAAEVEKVIWETVPDLASAMISKEIEKIKSEF